MSVSTGEPELVRITVNESTRVTGLFERPAEPTACVVLAHGAGAGMHHPFMDDIASGLAGLRIASLRYQFPYMEKRSRRPDPAPLCHATVRAAVAAARERSADLPLIAAGKSFGGRMSSEAQAANALDGVRGLAFLGFPLHKPRQPSEVRAEHLQRVDIPMLFLQGTRDEFAEVALIRRVAVRLGARATLALFDQADHSFHVPARSGRNDVDVRNEILRTLAAFIAALGPKPKETYEPYA
jgi:predicted alpha/beta-hydrolase family hydrolase